MKKISSFTVNHLTLKAGLYVSRYDTVGENVVTTFDIRMKRPNFEPVMNTAEVHTIEHLGATFLRNHPQWSDKVIYFGPMGCRTGFYVILSGEYESEDVLPLIKEMFTFISQYTGQVPGAKAKECGNYLDINLSMAKYEAQKYLEVLNCADSSNLHYDE